MRSRAFSLRMREVSGYVGSIELKALSDGATLWPPRYSLLSLFSCCFPSGNLLRFLLRGPDCLTPASLQIVVKIPPRYGISSIEKENSWAHCLINSFSSQSAFGCAGKLIRVGDPIDGFAEPTSGGPDSSQIIAWGVCDPAVWKMTSPASVPNYFELNHNAMYRLPQMGAENSLYARSPETYFAFLAESTAVFGQFPPADPTDAPPKAVLRGRSAVRIPSRHRSRALGDRPSSTVPPSSWATATSAAIMVGVVFWAAPSQLFLSHRSNEVRNKAE